MADDNAGGSAASDEPGESGEASLQLRQRFEGLPVEAVTAVGALFGATPVVEPYEPAPGEAVYAIQHRGGSGNLRIVLWPTLARVDVQVGPHAWVAKGIVETEVIAGLEAIFRSADGGMIFVALQGDVLMVSGERAER